jgi:CDP-4-dehydro-6-deoxyglucose reductase, E3
LPTVEYAGREYGLSPGESVLDCLLKNGVAISYSCRSGTCQSCMVKAQSGTIPEKAQQGLKDTWKAQGYFLACSCYPETALKIASAENLRVPAVITSIAPLSDNVLQVKLRAQEKFEYIAGQYLNLFKDESLARSYSIASLPSEEDIELHVRLVPNGAMSGWLAKEAGPGTQVHIQGPLGSCFYVAGHPEQSLVLAGAGTGLAPLYGIVRDALSQGHTGPIWLFHGGVNARGLYLVNELRALAQKHANFRYVPSVLQGEAPEGGHNAALDDCILSAFADLEGWRGYVCGDPGLVNKLRKDLFLAGIASNAIYADAFLPSSNAQKTEKVA